MVKGVPIAADHSEGGQAVDELDDRVVLELELPGERADGREAVRRKPLDGEQQLVLLGLEPRLAGRLLAEGEEAPEEVAEMGQVLVIRLA